MKNQLKYNTQFVLLFLTRFNVATIRRMKNYKDSNNLAYRHTSVGFPFIFPSAINYFSKYATKTIDITEEFGKVK
jgi:hypothetical protein